MAENTAFQAFHTKHTEDHTTFNWLALAKDNIYSTLNFRDVFTQYASLLTKITNSSHTHSTDENSQEGPVNQIRPQKSEILQIKWNESILL
jgi:hypothetical protein